MSTNLKDTIKNRLVERSANYWGSSSRDFDDPILLMLYDVIASEIETLNYEMRNTEKFMLERLADFLVPIGYAQVKPAHSVMIGSPSLPVQKIDEYTHFYTSVNTRDEMGKDLYSDIFFTPLEKSTLYDIDVRHMVHHHKIYQCGEDKSLLSTIEKHKSYSDAYLWIGLQSKTEPETLNGLQLFLDLPKQSYDTTWLHIFNQGEWFLETGKRLIVESATEPSKSESNIYQQDNAYFGSMYKQLLYKVKTDNSGAYQLKNYPSEFELFLSEEQLKNNFKVPCIWLKVTLPKGLTFENLEKVNIRTNAFVVINRKLNGVKHHFGKGKTLLMRLTEGEHWLGLQAVIDDGQKHYLPLSMARIMGENSHNGYYSVRNGQLNKFDSMDAKSSLRLMTQRLREEMLSFKSLNLEFIKTTLEKLDAEINNLESKLKSKSIEEKQEKFFLNLEPHTNAESVDVQYWSSNGERANSISPRFVVQEYRNMVMKPDSLKFVTTVTSGRDPLSMPQKQDAFRYMLISNGKIVTENDLSEFLTQKFGQYIKNIEIKKGMYVSEKPKEGYVRCVQVDLTLWEKYRDIVNDNILKAQIESAVNEKSLLDHNIIISILSNS